MSIQITGVEQTLRALGKAKTEDAKTIAYCLDKGGDVILKKSQNYVPFLTGALFASGKKESKGQGFGATTTVSYGGPTAPYAMVVHEQLEVKHLSPTCAKYLTRASGESRGTITALLKRNLVISKASGPS